MALQDFGKTLWSLYGDNIFPFIVAPIVFGAGLMVSYRSRKGSQAEFVARESAAISAAARAAHSVQKNPLFADPLARKLVGM